MHCIWTLNSKMVLNIASSSKWREVWFFADYPVCYLNSCTIFIFSELKKAACLRTDWNDESNFIKTILCIQTEAQL